MLSKLLRERVTACAPTPQTPASVCVAAEGTTVRCVLASVDRLSCAPLQITYVCEAAPLAAEGLADRADRLSKDVTALAEPLAVVEIDRLNQTALLRSRAPKRVGQTIAYFEVHADRHHCVTIRRFHFDQTDRSRAAVPFPMTLDQLETLVSELESVQCDQPARKS